MCTKERVARLIYEAFPARPVPTDLFLEHLTMHQTDFHTELKHLLQKKSWPEITIDDWAMTGASPSLLRRYLKPYVYAYYLPSLLISSINQVEYLDFTLEGILPSGRKRRGTEPWWSEFASLLSQEQRNAIKAFLEFVRGKILDEIGEGNKAILEEAELFWRVGSPG